MLKFVAKVLVAGVGIYAMGEWLRKTQILEEAVTTGRQVVKQVLLEVAQEHLVKQQQGERP